MDIRQYLALVRRHPWILLGSIVIVVGSTMTFYELRPAEYRAMATALVDREDPNRNFTDVNSPDPSVNVQGQAAFIHSFAVAELAAESVPGSDPAELMGDVSFTADPETGIVRIFATDPDPERARAVASAFSRAFVENRREAEVAGRNRIIDTLQQRLDELKVRINELDQQIGDGGLPADASQLTAASASGPPGSPEAERFAAALQYEEIFTRQQQLQIEQGLDSGTVDHISDARLPDDPIGPGLLQSGIVAGVVGLLLGIGLALLKDYLDDRFQSREEVEQEAGLPVLAEVPVDKELRRGRRQLSSAARPLSVTSEAMRVLRTNLQNLGPDHRVRTLVITSAHPKDGKTFVAANLAVVYAQAGYRTIVVSSDLRRPAIDELFSAASRRTGLRQLLAVSRPPATARATAEPAITQQSGGPAPFRLPRVPVATATTSSSADDDLDSYLVETDVPNLWLLPAGAVPANPSELLASSTMAQVLRRLEAYADMVILDSPPLLAVTDAAVLASLADGAILVASLGQTPRKALSAARARLDAPNVFLVGLVLNKVATRRSSYGGYYDHEAEVAPAEKEDRPAKATKAVATSGAEPPAPAPAAEPVDDKATAELVDDTPLDAPPSPSSATRTADEGHGNGSRPTPEHETVRSSDLW